MKKRNVTIIIVVLFGLILLFCFIRWYKVTVIIPRILKPVFSCNLRKISDSEGLLKDANLKELSRFEHKVLFRKYKESISFVDLDGKRYYLIENDVLIPEENIKQCFTNNLKILLAKTFSEASENIFRRKHLKLFKPPNSIQLLDFRTDPIFQYLETTAVILVENAQSSIPVYKGDVDLQFEISYDYKKLLNSNKKLLEEVLAEFEVLSPNRISFEKSSGAKIVKLKCSPGENRFTALASPYDFRIYFGQKYITSLKNRDREAIKSVFRHEVGHILGLMHEQVGIEMDTNKKTECSQDLNDEYYPLTICIDTLSFMMAKCNDVNKSVVGFSSSDTKFLPHYLSLLNKKDYYGISKINCN